METKSFPIIQEERSTKSPDVLWSVYCKPTKKPAWFNKPKEILTGLIQSLTLNILVSVITD